MEEELKQLKAKVEELTAKLSASEGRCEKMSALCLKRLGKSFDDWAKEESDEHASLTALKAKVLELTGKSEMAEALGTIALAVTQSKELVTLKAQIADEKTRALESEFAVLLKQGHDQGKVPPAEDVKFVDGKPTKGWYIGLKTDLGLEKAVAALKEALPKTTPIVTLRGDGIHEPAPASAVDPMQITIARNCAGRFGGEAAFKEAASKA